MFSPLEIAAGNLSFHQDGTHETDAGFWVSVEDGNEDNTPPSEVFVSFVVTLENDPPTASDESLSMEEDGVYLIQVKDFSSYLDEEEDDLSDIQIVGLETSGDLEVFQDSRWTPVIRDQVISRESLDLGHLRFIPAKDGFGDPYTTFRFKVKDGSLWSLDSYLLSVRVCLLYTSPSPRD